MDQPDRPGRCRGRGPTGRASRSLRVALALLALLAGGLLAACDGDDAGAGAATGGAPASGDGAVDPRGGGAPNGDAADSGAGEDGAGEDGAGEDGAARPTPEPTATTGVLARGELPLVSFTRHGGDEVTLPVEVVPPQEFSIGLSGRTTLDERGMVFYYPEPGERGGFWMQHTHFDLSIAFIDRDGVILAIAEMEAESREIVRPVSEYAYAVEAPAGWYAAHGVAPGDRMRLRFDIDDWYPHRRAPDVTRPRGGRYTPRETGRGPATMRGERR